jgi:hypothetical protein
MYLGDGMCRFEYQRQTTGEDAYQMSLIVKQSQVSSLERVLESYNIKYSIKKHEGSKEVYYTYRTRDDRVAKWLRSLVGDSSNKHFPEIINEELCWNVLSGFVDSDGNVDSDKIHLCNTNLELIEGIEEYLNYLGIEFTRFVQKTPKKECVWITPKASEVPYMKLKLRIDYKRDRFEVLKQRSRGRKRRFDRDWFYDNYSLLEQVLPRTTFKRRFQRESWYLDDYELEKLKKYQETGGI